MRRACIGNSLVGIGAADDVRLVISSECPDFFGDPVKGPVPTCCGVGDDSDVADERQTLGVGGRAVDFNRVICDVGRRGVPGDEGKLFFNVNLGGVVSSVEATRCRRATKGAG
jgi:hypothetical protein